MKRNNIKVKYDPDADVLSLEQPTKAGIEYAKEMGTLVVHFSKKEQPVLIEVLEASKLFRQNKAPFRKVGGAVARSE